MFHRRKFRAGLRAAAVVLGPCAAWAGSGSASGEELPLETMLGPYPSIAAYCAAGTQSKTVADGYRCVPAPNDWDVGVPQGPRGAFRSARMLRVRGKLGPHDVEFCRIAMQSTQGWFVSNHALPCQGQAPGGTVASTTLGFSRWADEIAPGILMVYARHEDNVENESWRWWGPEVIRRDSVPSRTSFTFCGMNTGRVPSCTPRLDLCGDANPITVNQGRIEVPKPEMLPLYCLATWQTGTYKLKLQNAEPGPRPWMPKYVTPQDERDLMDKGLLGATAAYGPFQSLGDYCQNPPSFEFNLNMPEFGLKKEICSPRPGWTGELGGHGPLLGARLVSVFYDDGNIPVHYCRVALRTKQGWFVTSDNEPCRGKFLPTSEMTTALADTQARPLRWLDSKGSVLLIDALHSDHMGLCRKVRVCGVGPSGIPSCTPAVSAGSKDSRDVRLVANQLKIVPRSRPARRRNDDQADAVQDDDRMCFVERDSYELSFP